MSTPQLAASIPLPESASSASLVDTGTPLLPPRASFLSPDPSLRLSATPSSQFDSGASNNASNSAPLIPPTPSGQGADLRGDVTSDDNLYSEKPPHASGKKRLYLLIAGALLVLAALVLVIILPVYYRVIKPNQNHNLASGTGSGSDSGSGSGSSGGGQGSSTTKNPQSPTGDITGGDGSTVIMDDGTTFVYQNKFGGYWWQDTSNPHSTNARANSWTPPLNTSWTWGKDRIFGVNLGGLFVPEPFIIPSLFQRYPGAVDEWSLSQLMAADTSPGGGFALLEEHYKTFITEQDIAEIAGAGLNWVRIPIPFWAIDTWNGTASGHSPNTKEPFLSGVSWKYIVRVLSWCRKYGIRVNLDLHTIPGSQNGYNHSGKLGQVNFLFGTMGMANAQRALNYIRIITEWISQPEWRDTVQIFGIINEASMSSIGKDILGSFYLEAHNLIRNITSIGEGNGPFICIHEGFSGVSPWAGFMTGADRMMLDTHPYFAFSGGPNDDPIDTGTSPSSAGGSWPARACNTWGNGIFESQTAFGVTVAGEWSLGWNDCGLFLKGVPGSHTYGGDCSVWQDASQWGPGVKAGLLALAEAGMDTLGDWFFWTWKVGNSSESGHVESPLWSYKLGLEGGWIPQDPRTAKGKCKAIGASSGNVGSDFSGPYSAWQTGGSGAGTIPPSVSASLGPWPPAQISPGLNVASLPTYASTGTVITLSPEPSVQVYTRTDQSLTTITVAAGNEDGWTNDDDKAGGPVEVSGCDYPNAWDAQDAQVPVGGGCFGGGAKRGLRRSGTGTGADAGVITPAPRMRGTR